MTFGRWPWQTPAETLPAAPRRHQGVSDGAGDDDDIPMICGGRDYLDHTSDRHEDELMGQAPPKGKSAAPKPESSDDGGQPAGKWNHYAEIVRPERLGQWAIEKNPTLRYLHEAMQDWGERRGNPSRRPVCLTCPHEFRADGSLPPAWMFVRVSVNKAGVPKQMILIGICEKCAAKDDATLLREGCADLRRAFPDMPEFKMQVVQEGSGVAN